MAADKMKEILKHFPDLDDGWKEMEEKLKAEPAERETLSLKYREMLQRESSKESLVESEFTKAKRSDSDLKVMEANEVKKKVLFADLDGTLIDTISGSVFPKGIWDMQFKWDVIDAIKDYGFKCLIIITNQGGIEKGFVNEKHFVKGKMNYITKALEEYLGIPVEYQYCSINDKECEYRKPNTGMLKTACWKFLANRWNMVIDKDEMFMIGDASGKQGQFSDSDKKTAENFGIDYFDVDDFKQYVELNKCNTKL